MSNHFLLDGAPLDSGDLVDAEVYGPEDEFVGRIAHVHEGSESDLKRIEEDPLKNGYPGWTLQIVRDPLRGTISGGPINETAADVYQPVGPFLANVALLLVLGLLFIEIILAWHFGHTPRPKAPLRKPLLARRLP